MKPKRRRGVLYIITVLTAHGDHNFTHACPFMWASLSQLMRASQETPPRRKATVSSRTMIGAVRDPRRKSYRLMHKMRLSNSMAD